MFQGQLESLYYRGGKGDLTLKLNMLDLMLIFLEMMFKELFVTIEVDVFYCARFQSSLIFINLVSKVNFTWSYLAIQFSEQKESKLKVVCDWDEESLNHYDMNVNFTASVRQRNMVP
ncbi:16148_t:CDS:1 [Entrophospora sp. SA101]|nr:16148_t:CDS:1 [Entrophospora sp. SA101]